MGREGWWGGRKSPLEPESSPWKPTFRALRQPKLPPTQPSLSLRPTWGPKCAKRNQCPTSRRQLHRSLPASVMCLPGSPHSPRVSLWLLPCLFLSASRYPYRCTSLSWVSAPLLQHVSLAASAASMNRSVSRSGPVSHLFVSISFCVSPCVRFCLSLLSLHLGISAGA